MDFKTSNNNQLSPFNNSYHNQNESLSRSNSNSNINNIINYYDLINEGKMKLKILLTWRDYALAIQRKRQNMDPKNQKNSFDDDNNSNHPHVFNIPGTGTVDNYKLSVIVSSPTSVITTTTNFMSLHQASVPKIVAKKSTIVKQPYKTSVITRRQALADISLLPPRWEPNNLKILRRLFCTPVTIIIFFCLLIVNLSTHWIYIESKKVKIK